MSDGRVSLGGDHRSAREEMGDIVADQSAAASFDDILRRLAFHRMVLRGLDSLAERHFTSAEIRHRLETWGHP